MKQLIKASVVVDVSSLAHRLGDLDGDARRGDVRLDSLLQVLAGRGYEVARLLIGVATIPVMTGPDSDRTRAMEITQLNREWIETETATVPENVTVQTLAGGHDGTREIGVDDLVVAAALLEAARIASTATDEVVLVVTHDGDMDHLSAYGAPAVIRLVGAYDRDTHRRLRRVGAPYESLYDYELRNCGLQTPLVLSIDDDDPSRGHDLVPKGREDLPEGECVAVVDAYGIACSAACALGISRLPNVGSLRSLLAVLGYPVETPLLVTIPDIAHAQPSDDALTQARNLAWYHRDRDLDALADELDGDGDPTTQVRRGLLRPANLPPEWAHRLDRSGPTRAAKRVATQLTADLVSLVSSKRTDHVLLLTDSPHIVWVQAALSEWLPDSPIRITRLGVYAAPVTINAPNGNDRLPPGAFRMLTEDRIAQVTRTNSLVGRELRQRLHDTVNDDQLGQRRWRVVAFDAEIDGVRIRSVDDPSFDMLLADALALGVKPGDEVTLDGYDVELHFHPGFPTLVPVPSLNRSGPGEQARSYADVVVVERDGAHLRFDIDGDGIADGQVPLGHDLRPFGDPAAAVLGVLGTDTDDWYFVSSDDISPAGRPVIVEVVETGDGISVRPDGVSNKEGSLHPPPNSPPVIVDVGDRIWAIDTSNGGEPPQWVTLSSPIHRTDTPSQPSIPI